jgi:hypothetical protein
MATRPTGKLGMNMPSRAAVSEQLQFRDYFTASELPTPPKHFGWWSAVPEASWGMLGNDQYGDCVIARSMHAVKYRNAVQARTVDFSTQDALDDYYAVNGTTEDNGTDPLAMEKYLQSTGVRDTTNARHKIDGSVVLQTGDVSDLMLAMFLFDGCSICLNLPDSAETQFANGEPWSVVAGATIIGGHDVMGMCPNSNGHIVCVTWGGIQAMTPEWFRTYNNLLICDFSLEALDAKGLSSRGYDKSALIADMADIAA